MTKLIDKNVRISGMENVDNARTKHNLVYRMYNQLNGRYYIGVHVTNDIGDGYLGSGKIIRRAILDHGVKAFVKEILFDFPTEKEAYDKERELVTTDTILPKNKMSYNVKPGGEGGYPHGSGDSSSLRVFRYRDPRGYAELITRRSEMARMLRLGKKGYKRPEHSKLMSGDGNPMFGVNAEDMMTQEAIVLKRKRMREHAKGKLNMEKVKSDPIKYAAWKEKIRNSRLGRKSSSETKAKHSEQSKNSKWWNNGTTEMFRPECPAGFAPGRLPLSNDHKKKIAVGTRLAFSKTSVSSRRIKNQEDRFWNTVIPPKLPDNWCAIRQLTV